jgi:hypothetical protein
MTRNMGTFDRGLRAFVVAPAAIVAAFILGAGTIAGVILFVVAGIMLATAATGLCPTYTVLGISTHPRGYIASATAFAPVTPESNARGVVSPERRALDGTAPDRLGGRNREHRTSHSAS